MKTTERAPGPWKYHMTYTAGEPQGFAVSAGALNLCQLMTGDNDAEEEADARLIAAAPDLLAALEGLLGCTELNLDGMDGDTRYLIENARAVIAKAKGAA